MGEPISPRELERAEVWYQEHKAHIDGLISSSGTLAYPPTGADVYSPAFWSPAHWRWYFEGRKVKKR